MGFLDSSTDEFQVWTPDPGDYRTDWTGANVYFQRQGNIVYMSGVYMFSGTDWYDPGWGGRPLNVPAAFIPAAGFDNGILGFANGSTASQLSSCYVHGDGFILIQVFQPTYDVPLDTSPLTISISGSYLLGPLF